MFCSRELLNPDPDRFVLIIDNLFTAQDCARYLAAAEASNEWQVAAINGGKPDLQVWIIRTGSFSPLTGMYPISIVYKYVLPELGADNTRRQSPCYGDVRPYSTLLEGY